MILENHTLLLLIAVGLLICCNTFVNAEQEEVLLSNAEIVPETLAEEKQGHENVSGRKVRQFGFPPGPPPFGYPPFGGYHPPPPPPPPGYYGPGFGGGFGGGGFGGGGFQRTRVVTRTRTRVVNRFRGGFYG